MTDIITAVEFPSAEGLGLSPHIVGKIRDWAEDDKADIAEDVDTQVRNWFNEDTVNGTYTSGEQKVAVSQVMTYKAWRLFKVGTRWAINTDHPAGATLEMGDIVEVIEEGYRNDAGVYTMIRVQQVDHIGGQHPLWAVHACHLTNAPDLGGSDSESSAVTGPSREDLLAEVATLNTKVTSLEQQRLSAVARADNLYRALDVVNEGLNEEGEKRNWCDELEGFYEEVNNNIVGYEFEGREEEFTVNVRVPVTVMAVVSTTVSARRGTDESDICEMAEERVSNDYSSSDLLDQADSYTADADWERLESEVE